MTIRPNKSIEDARAPALAETILTMVERVEADERRIGVLSTGEALAVALVLDRKDMLEVRNGGYTMLEAVERLGADWFRAALIVQRART
jgi:hypothetical protein